MTAITTVDLDSVAVATPVTRLRANRVPCRIHVDASGQSFGDRVQDLRERRGLTQVQLAEACGLSVGPIRNVEWERGWGVQAETVGLIAIALRADMADLWFGTWPATVRQEATP